MSKNSGTPKRVVKNSARTGHFSHKAARSAAKKAAAQRKAPTGKGSSKGP